MTVLTRFVPLLGCKDKVGRGRALTRIVVFLGKLDRQKVDAPRQEKTVAAQGVEAGWRREWGEEGQWKMNGAKGPELLMWVDSGRSAGIAVCELEDRSGGQVVKCFKSRFRAMQTWGWVAEGGGKDHWRRGLKTILKGFNSRPDEVEEWISELEDKAMKIIQTEQQNEKEFYKVKIT